MANEVTIKRDGDVKEIKIIIENNKGMIIKKDIKTGGIISVTDEKGEKNNEIMETTEVTLNGKAVTQIFPDDVVIFTHSSPGCGWYWTGTRWIWRCT